MKKKVGVTESVLSADVKAERLGDTLMREGSEFRRTGAATEKVTPESGAESLLTQLNYRSRQVSNRQPAGAPEPLGPAWWTIRTLLGSVLQRWVQTPVLCPAVTISLLIRVN